MNRPHVAGYLLVEITVALMLTATAMAGLTRWQLWALQDNHQAWQEMHAALLLDDLAQRLLLRWAPVAAYASEDVGSVMAHGESCAEVCDGTAFARRELAHWWQVVLADPAALPEAQACLRITDKGMELGLSWQLRDSSDRALLSEGPLECLAPHDGRRALTIGLAL